MPVSHKRKIYVLVKNFAWTNDDVEIFRTVKEARGAFRQYTGFPFNDKYLLQDNEEYNEKYCETKIYGLDMPGFLEFKKGFVKPKK